MSSIGVLNLNLHDSDPFIIENTGFVGFSPLGWVAFNNTSENLSDV